MDCGGLSISGTGGPVVSYPATTYGSTATYSCSTTGYELIGSSTRVCQSIGAWSGSQPYCQSKGRRLPSFINFFASILLFLCVSKLTNSDKFMWSLQFVVVSCGSLSISGAGGITVSTTGIVYNHVATYTCNQVGYELIGGSQRTCQANGHWSGSAPYCQCELLFPRLLALIDVLH